MSKLKIAFDTNNWVSFTIGKRLIELKDVLLAENISTYICQEIKQEYVEVIQRPKLAKYVKPERMIETLELMAEACIEVALSSTVQISRDAKDNYLLALCQDASLDYLMTGDNDLLVLKTHQNTKILTFADFIIVLDDLSA